MFKRSISIYELLFVVFIYLKLSDKVNLNWLIVFIPLIVAIVHYYVSKYLEVTGANRDIKAKLQDAYIRKRNEVSRNELLKPLEKKFKDQNKAR